MKSTERGESNLAVLLASGRVDEFNSMRGQRRRVELFAADLAEAQIPGVDLSNAWLEKSDLTSADLTDANLSRADLTGIDGAGAKLCDAMAVGAKLREAFLDGADLSGCDLSHADLAEAVLTNTQGPHLRLTNARLRETDATGASWPEADLVEARLHKANLTRIDLTGADLTECTAQECILVEAKLDRIIALRAKMQGANLQRASLVGARLEEANLENADLSGANLERADLRRANLTKAILTGATLRGANLADAVLEGVDLSGLDVADVDLSGVDPRALGLTNEQLGTLAAVGSAAAVDAPLRFTEVSVARSGGAVAVLWENAEPTVRRAPRTEPEPDAEDADPDSDEAVDIDTGDGEESLSLRWTTSDGRSGVLPVSAEGVLARAVVPTTGGFELFVLQERPGGAALLRYRLGAEGEIGAAKVEPLGYEPGVRPVFRPQDGTTFVWGLARRGPTLVVQKVGPADPESGNELTTIHTEKQPTARGFLGGHGAVLACKGGVVVPVGPKGAGSPLRTPPSFPGRLAASVLVGDRVLAVWADALSEDEETGGLRFAWLGRGITPKPEILTPNGHPTSIDALSRADGAWIGWTEIADEGTRVWVARFDANEVAEGFPVRLPIEADMVDELRFAAEAATEGGLPLITLVTMEEALLVVDAEGKELTRFE